MTLAPYACQTSTGRIYKEPDSKHRSPFQRDRDRIIHSRAFRRLKHKTQVFIHTNGDHYRTRLTHSLEVAQIARTLARALNVDEDLTEAIALAHDLGHTPFGHTGEDAMKECMRGYGGFEHNDQTLLILTELEQKSMDYTGLNLTIETLDGIIKHNGPYTKTPLPYALARLQDRQDFALNQYSHLEAQIAAIADDIAYNNHDMEDGIRAGIFKIDDLGDIPRLKDFIKNGRDRWPNIDDKMLTQHVKNEMIGIMVEDVITMANKTLSIENLISIGDIQRHSDQVITFSPPMKSVEKALKSFLWKNMYAHENRLQIVEVIHDVIPTLFHTYMAEPYRMPDRWHTHFKSANDDAVKARCVCNYIAGMTDQYAIREYRALPESKNLKTPEFGG